MALTNHKRRPLGRNNDGDRFDGGDHRNALLVEKIAKEESASIP